jgi:acyl carrier protein
VGVGLLHLKPLALSLSKGRNKRSWFDKLTTNGIHARGGHGKIHLHLIQFSGERMSATIIPQLSQQIAEKILKQPNRVIQPDEPLLSSGLIDSFSLVDLALLVEDTFGVRIDDFELTASTFDSITQLADLIQARQA